MNVSATAPHPSTQNTFFQRTMKVLSEIIEKVSNFIKRYWKEVIVYSITSALTFFASLHSHGMSRAAATLGGFFWSIAFTKGSPIAEDFLEPVDTDQNCYFGEEMGKRFNEIKNIKNYLTLSPTENAPSTGWCLIYGPVGIGKTSSAKWIAKQLTDEHTPVFVLKKREAKSIPESLRVINKAFAKYQKTPVLIIDDADSILQSDSLGLKSMAKCNLLAIMQKRDGIDPGIESRFGSQKFKFKALTKPQVIEVITKTSSYQNVAEIVNDICKEESPPPDLLRLAWQKIAEITQQTPQDERPN